ncbi:L-histidine Nalpha-methyltransferase / hercynylcysteine S-oxide synthase [Entomortierella parvispora]|uniref:L-histidine Nalpha-methyltransferase / hercynylcysteine S-oxide synthase n=1 Tax=Entomortierella parvispora TaxID=205924 RepID=A0A9P3H8G6_9FUNG|nr:L-histidine Nalpha-methyltransferase / hercynylcysteine S-oxide synthase [Entomortierella parvispora]
MAILPTSHMSVNDPTIIDLRHSNLKNQAEALVKDDHKRVRLHQDPQSAYPSPPSASGENEQQLDITTANLSPLVLNDDAVFSEVADSDTMDGLTDTHSVEGRVSDSSASSVMQQDEDDDGEPLTAPGFDLPKMILAGLCPAVAGAPKTIPTMVLYDDRGLQLFDEITYLDDYYLTTEEIQILERDGDKIVEHIPDNSVVVELGAGSLRKTVLLLNALESRRKNIRYYALDLMLDELTKSLKSLGKFSNVKTAGLWGTYEEGLAFVSSLGAEVPKTLLWLGSSIGNLTREEARDFITSYRKTLNVGDNWLIGIDRRNDAQEITLAYNDTKGVTREFVLNALGHINVIFDQSLMDRQKFQYFAQYNVEVGRHEAYYQVVESHSTVFKAPKEENNVQIDFVKGELINVEYSYKWSPAETAALFEDTEFTKVGQWTSSSDRYDLHLVRKTPFYFKSTDAKTCPSQQEWTELWKSWDVVTTQMIQHPSMLLEKPIALRHPFLFYLGHIPVFLDTQLSRALKEPFSEPAHFNVIFERGIDPDVDDPTKCHAHSEVPDEWPAIETILEFRDRVRERLFNILNDPVKYPIDRRLARVLFMAFEHEAMHLETLIYMLVQSPNTLPPPSLPAPWADNMATFESRSVLPPVTWITVDPSKLDKEFLSLGHLDLESDDLLDANKQDLNSTFGWDNEHPEVHSEPTPAFKIQSRQVTNNEYMRFLNATGGLSQKDRLPASWLANGEEVSIKTVYGPVPIRISGDWPVSCSNLQATAYADWYSKEQSKQFMLPTEQQLSMVFKWKQSSVPRSGLENFGFRQWYPTIEAPSPSSTSDVPIKDFSGPGGLWDWTRTKFAPLGPGFKTSALYPGYSTDFFDEKHMVVLGASWATHPRLAKRRSFRNWYQANYPFVFAGFRLVERC